MEKVIMGTRLPAKLWLNEVEDSCMSQIMDLTSLPFAFKHIAIMPMPMREKECQLAVCWLRRV